MNKQDSFANGAPMISACSCTNAAEFHEQSCVKASERIYGLRQDAA